MSTNHSDALASTASPGFVDRQVVYRSPELGAGAIEAYFQPYNGEMKAHLRFVSTRKRDGEQRPGKGISVNPDAIPVVLAAAAALLLAGNEES